MTTEEPIDDLIPNKEIKQNLKKIDRISFFFF